MKSKKRLLVFLTALMFMMNGCMSGGTDKNSQETADRGSENTGNTTLPYAQWPEYDWDNLTRDGKLLYYDDENFKSERLIDVSRYQKEIDWEQVVSSGVIDGCILRIGVREYGDSANIKIDERFEEYYSGAGKAGLKVYGVYFYSAAVNETEAEEEAQLVLSELEKMEVGKDVTVFLDIEENNRNKTLTSEQISMIADRFCQIIIQKGYGAGIYTNGRLGRVKLDLSLFAEYGVWYAHYGSEPGLTSGFYIWQYKKDGKVKGISGKVDVNLLMIPKK